jgi:multisubunit Na+/H+ antiporter MnhG subunit
MQDTTVQKTADIAGAVLSQLCLVHCLLLPLLLSVLPSLSVPEFLGGETFHLVALLLTTPVALFALRRGTAKHGSSRPSALGAAALALLWMVFLAEDSLGHDLLAAFNVTGGFLLAWAHWQNWSLTKVSCSCDPSLR